MLRLKFRVNPKSLAEETYVEDPVDIVINDVEAMKGLLGDSGLRMAEAGMVFQFQREISEGLIKKGIAIEV